MALAEESAPPKETQGGRVMHLLNSRHFNGAENVAANCMTGLAPKWEGVFVSRNGPVGDAVTQRNLAFAGVSRLRLSVIRRIVNDFRPDLIHAHDYRASLVAAFTRVPVISHLHNNYPWAQRLGPVTLAYGLALPRFKRVVAVSDSILEEHYFRRALLAKGVVVGNGVDIEGIRKRSGGRAPKRDLVFVGRLTEQKDPLAFIRIVEALVKKGMSISAVMLGSGELLETCRKAVEEAGLSKRIDLPGYVSNPYLPMANARICVAPSRWEGFGLVAVEAMALGLPVVGRPVGGLALILNDLSPDLLCNEEDAMVARVAGLLANPRRCAALSTKARRLVEQKYSLELFLSKVEQVYEHALCAA